MRIGTFLAVAIPIVARCTSDNSAIEPSFQSVDISKIGALQFAVGTANIGYVRAQRHRSDLRRLEPIAVHVSSGGDAQRE